MPSGCARGRAAGFMIAEIDTSRFTSGERETWCINLGDGTGDHLGSPSASDRAHLANLTSFSDLVWVALLRSCDLYGMRSSSGSLADLAGGQPGRRLGRAWALAVAVFTWALWCRVGEAASASQRPAVVSQAGPVVSPRPADGRVEAEPGLTGPAIASSGVRAPGTRQTKLAYRPSSSHPRKADHKRSRRLTRST